MPTTTEPAPPTPESVIAETLCPGPQGKVGRRTAQAIIAALAAAGFTVTARGD